jgi:hypothetical protein
VRKRNDPYSTIAAIVALASFIGGAAGAASALAYSSRRVEGVEDQVDDLGQRLRSLEGLDRRVDRLERGASANRRAKARADSKGAD